MKKLKLILCAALAYIGLASQSSAAGVNLYNAHEFNLDIFGTRAFANSDSDRLFYEDNWGGGLALSYFLTRYIGVGIDGQLLEASGDTVGTSSLNATFRLPLGDSGVAVYGLGGVGLIFNPDDLYNDHGEDDDTLFTGHVGAGAEWRFTEGFGAFTDWRYKFNERGNSDYSELRMGLRFVF